MKPGLYILANLDGGPIDVGDRAVLGLAPSHAGYPVAVTPCFAVAAVDQNPGAVHVVQDDGVVTCFAGWLDERDELADALQLPKETSPALLAATGIERYGAEASARMAGTWSYCRWHAASRTLTLLTSELARDDMFVAADGPRIAVAPEKFTLTRLAWVGRTLDPLGLAVIAGRAALRQVDVNATSWRGVRRVSSGVRETHAATGCRKTMPVPLAALPVYQGTFEDAVADLDVLCRRIVGQQMQRHPQCAFLLSGGLDSTLLSSLGARELDASMTMFCLSSVSPAGSEVPDERKFSTAVAEQLGIPLHFVAPDGRYGPYLPPERYMALVQEPVLGLRHYLYDSLWGEAQARGATAIFDGVQGEATITHKPGLAAHLWWLRRWRMQSRLWWRQRQALRRWPAPAFHVRFAPELLATIPAEWRDTWRQGPARPERRRRGMPVGIHPAVRKSSSVGNAIWDGLRVMRPYTDRRLHRFAASLPAEFFETPTETRALARAMLRGRVPEFVRTRGGGLPISPDYRERLRDEALQAAGRVPAFREGGVGEYLDLGWLEQALRATAAGKTDSATQTTAQITCAAAEFLLWIKTQ